jgi:stage II sporulation protein D
MARIRSALAVGLLPLLITSPAFAQEQLDDAVSATSIVFQPAERTWIAVGDRLYAGTLSVTAHGGGLALVEETTIDNYLLGIREVPFSWPEEALAAQVVAARTYLAWTLARGRTSNGRTFNYDICATDACQVYAGVGGLGGPEGFRWRQAVGRTSGEVLITNGRPVQALYSSTSDGRTRNVEDVFPGASPDPHLRAVESPGETSPFVGWEFALTQAQATRMFAHAGLLQGRLVDVTSRLTADGDGPWTITVHGSGGASTIDTWTLRTRLNRAAADLYPGVFPVFRPESERRYPQTIMSPNYTIESELFLARPSDGPLGLETRFMIRGGGWGHLVGMSQYGAEAMATAGAAYPDILAHFYGNVRPAASDVLPDRIRVGLGTVMREIDFVPDGAMRVIIDGTEVTPGDLGAWSVTWENGVALVNPPEGLGLPPEVDGWRTFADSRGVIELVTVRSRTAAEIRIVVTEDRVVVSDSGWHVRQAGVIAVDIQPRGYRTALTVTVTARSPLGGDSTSLRILGGME